MPDLSAYRERFAAVGAYMLVGGFLVYGNNVRHFADAALAALAGALGEAEAELARLKALYATEAAKNFQYEAERAQPGILLAKLTKAEAELAELKARRCEECDCREGSSHYCLVWSINTPDQHSCADWTERREP